jgi:hypothetical protein
MHASLIHRKRRSRDAPGGLGVRKGRPALANLSPGPRQLGVYVATRDVFGKRFGGLRQGGPGLAIAISGGGDPVPLKLPSLRLPGYGVL